MSLEVVSTAEPGRLRFHVSGKYSFDSVNDFIDLVKAEADKAGVRKVLIDSREMEGQLTEADRFQGGQKIAQVMGSRIRTALVLPVGQVTKLGEMAAVNRGAILLVTDSMEEAAEWLG